MPKPPDKQAVVLIHGIGDQKPMDTLRGFVKAVWVTDTKVHHGHAVAGMWSKPDKISGSFELRRLTTTKNASGVRADFFEFYWAHMMKGTKLHHVVDWAKLLLVRPPWKVPRPLLGPWIVLAVTVILVLLFLLNGTLPDEHQLVHMPFWVSGLISAALSSVTAAILIPIVGDAARYLNPAPENIQRRHEIRAAGVKLIERLHESGEYGRIVIVGHSLGSVIAYDILTHAWPRFHDSHANDGTSETAPDEKLRALEKAGEVHGIQEAQRDYLDELRAQGNRWLVTDLVTLGSPMTHAEILMASADRSLTEKQADREFPTCPPTLEEDTFAFRKGKFQVPHHAAVFGPTRWTNLYFPVRALLWGDVVGGPLQARFGHGIRDVTVHTTERCGLFSHTLYWSAASVTDSAAPEPIRALREAVNLLDSRAQ